MLTLPAILALVAAAYWAFSAHNCFRVVRSVKVLEDLSPPPPIRWPKLTLVIAARNEAAEMEGALASRLKEDYPELELVSIEYEQAHAPTEYQAAVEDVRRARESFAEALMGLQLLEPEATRAADARLARLAALVGRRAPARQVAAAVEQAEAAVREAARL